MSGWLHFRGGQVGVYDTEYNSTDPAHTSMAWGPSIRLRSNDNKDLAGLGIYYDANGGVGFQLGSRYYGGSQQCTLRVSSQSNKSTVFFSQPQLWWDALSTTSMTCNAWTSIFFFSTDTSLLIINIPTERLSTSVTKWNVTNVAWTLHGIYNSGSPIAVTTDTLTHDQTRSGRSGTTGFSIIYSKPSAVPSNLRGAAVLRNNLTISAAD